MGWWGGKGDKKGCFADSRVKVDQPQTWLNHRTGQQGYKEPSAQGQVPHECTGSDRGILAAQMVKNLPAMQETRI